jgi:hypothetical protein
MAKEWGSMFSIDKLATSRPIEGSTSPRDIHNRVKSIEIIGTKNAHVLTVQYMLQHGQRKHRSNRHNLYTYIAAGLGE